jgi:hypothetical protein
MRRSLELGLLLTAAALLTDCGGGSATPAYRPGVFQPESAYAAQCSAPRSGVDPITASTYPDRQGSVLDENSWLRSWTHDLYLWYSEVPDQDPAGFATPAAYFPVLKTPAITASGSPKDKFHFTYTTAYWESLSQTGQQPGYGPTWAVVAATPPRLVVVAYTEPSVPVNLARGAQVVGVDGVDLVNAADAASVAAINAGLYPATVGESHVFTVLDAGASVARSLTLVAVNVATTTVQDAGAIASAPQVGYMLFNDHLATAEAALIDAFDTLQAAAVTDLVLDIRYNGGGFLDIASEVAYMIAGPARTAGQTFELEQFNAQHPTIDPVTGVPLAPIPFHATTQGFSVASGQPLPHLDLARVYVLTGSTTCSASEAIINSLTGIGIDVIQVGTTTCGKPYGFYPTDNCGTTYFSIQFQGVNAQGFGAYPDGFSPANTASGTIGAKLPGCSVADDFAHPLGDPNEARLAAALAYRAGQSCPAPASALAGRRATAAAARAGAASEAHVFKSPWLENRILRKPGSGFP